MTEFELTLFASMLQLLPQLLTNHPYGLYELAQESANQLHQPVQIVLTPFSEALNTLTKAHQINFDRARNRVMLTA